MARPKETWRLAQDLEKHVEPRWTEMKERGNVAMRAGDLVLAAACYTDALMLCQPALAVYILSRGACACEAHRSVARFAQVGVLLKRVSAFLSNGLGQSAATCSAAPGVIRITLPNRPAAVCLANRAHVLLTLGRFHDALCDARASVRACPEYLKAHRHCVEAHMKLGQDAEAAGIEKTIHMYELSSEKLPWYGACLLAAGLISYEEHLLVYLPRWRYHCIAEACAAGAGRPGEVINVTSSLVDFMGGQWWVCGFQYVDDDFNKLAFDCVDFACVDNEHGHDLLRPPHGRASACALQHAHGLLNRFLRSLRRKKLGVSSLRLGQGLRESVESIKRTAEESYPNIGVYPALTTATSISHFDNLLGLVTPEISA